MPLREDVYPWELDDDREKAQLWNEMTDIVNHAVQGVADGYKLARGVHTQVAASDTVVTGLATVVAVLAGFEDAPGLTALFVQASIGNQAGAPAAGSVLLKTFKPTAVNDVTPIAATVFGQKIAWVAIGT